MSQLSFVKVDPDTCRFYVKIPESFQQITTELVNHNLLTDPQLITRWPVIPPVKSVVSGFNPLFPPSVNYSNAVNFTRNSDGLITEISFQVKLNQDTFVDVANVTIPTTDFLPVILTKVPLALIGGKPAIAFGTTDCLKFVQSTNPFGTLRQDWPEPVVIETGSSFFVEAIVIATIKNSRQNILGTVISYIDRVNNKIRLAFSQDNQNWTTVPVGDGIQTATTARFEPNLNKIVVDNLVVTPDNKLVGVSNDITTGFRRFSNTIDTNVAFPSLTNNVNDNVDSGCYYDTSNRQLKFIQTTEPSIAFWSTPLVLDQGGESNSITVLIDGRLAIAYSDTNQNLRFITSKNSRPTSIDDWNDPIQIYNANLATPPAFILSGIQLRLISTNPMADQPFPVIIFSTTNPQQSKLHAVSSKDQEGRSWNSTITLVSLSEGRPTGASLAQVANLPACTYFDLNDGYFKYSLLGSTYSFSPLLLS